MSTMHNIVITGCSDGLGKALARYFSSQKIHVYAISRSELNFEQSNITAIQADICTQHGRQIIQQALKSIPCSLIHNAAVATPSSFAELSENTLQQHFMVNVIAPLLLTQQLLLNITQQRILHITSGAAHLALPGLLPYCSTKASFEHAAKCLQQELKQQQTLVGLLSPGMLDTPMQQQFRQTNTEQLPGKDFYQQAFEQQKLIDPRLAAQFTYWVMTQTSDDTFTQSTWDIYNPDYATKWLPAHTIPPSR